MEITGNKVVLNLTGSDKMKHVEPDDFVIHLRSFQGGIEHSTHRGKVSNAYTVLRPGADVEPRFFRWVLKAPGFIQELSTTAEQLRDGQSIRFDQFARVGLPLPLLEEQRRIADFLDDQVTRIDALVRLRNEQRTALTSSSGGILAAVLAERGVAFPGRLDEAFPELPEGWRVAEFAHVLRQLTNGYVGPTRDILVDDGVRYIQSLHVKDGSIDFDRGHYFVDYAWHHSRPRINLRPGDVLIVQTGDIGQVAVVPEDFGEASCHALQIARVEPSAISSGFLGEYLRSDFGRHQLLSRATGALHPHLEAGIKSAPILVPPLQLQSTLVEAVSAERELVAQSLRRLEGSIDLFREYKRSLIAAAVTGELDVATARLGVPG